MFAPFINLPNTFLITKPMIELRIDCSRILILRVHRLHCTHRILYIGQLHYRLHLPGANRSCVRRDAGRQLSTVARARLPAFLLRARAARLQSGALLSLPGRSQLAARSRFWCTHLLLEYFDDTLNSLTLSLAYSLVRDACNLLVY